MVPTQNLIFQQKWGVKKMKSGWTVRLSGGNSRAVRRRGRSWGGGNEMMESEARGDYSVSRKKGKAATNELKKRVERR